MHLWQKHSPGMPGRVVAEVVVDEAHGVVLLLLWRDACFGCDDAPVPPCTKVAWVQLLQPAY